MANLYTLTADDWNVTFASDTQKQATDALENGQIIFFQQLPFRLLAEEKLFLSPQYIDKTAKNISYQPDKGRLWGVKDLTDQQRLQLKCMLDRYARYTKRLIHNLFPHYIKDLDIARTSFRPVEVSGRITSYRKDDKRLHVDAFPSAPNQGKRIIRVFCNINPNHQHRVWRVGEPFAKVVDRFIEHIPKPVPGAAHFLRLLRITKSFRTAYDHYMLQLHDRMKQDEQYQQQALHEEISFPEGSTWIVQTDQVSHAALKGQYVLEQTFYLPVQAMLDPQRSPLHILQKKLNCSLL
jgi:hypothetical protein